MPTHIRPRMALGGIASTGFLPAAMQASGAVWASRLDFVAGDVDVARGVPAAEAVRWATLSVGLSEQGRDCGAAGPERTVSRFGCLVSFMFAEQAPSVAKAEEQQRGRCNQTQQEDKLQKGHSFHFDYPNRLCLKGDRLTVRYWPRVQQRKLGGDK